MSPAALKPSSRTRLGGPPQNNNKQPALFVDAAAGERSGAATMATSVYCCLARVSFRSPTPYKLHAEYSVAGGVRVCVCS